MKKYIVLTLMVLGAIVSAVIAGISDLYSAALSPESFVLGNTTSDANQSFDSKTWSGVTALFIIAFALLCYKAKEECIKLKNNP